MIKKSLTIIVYVILLYGIRINTIDTGIRIEPTSASSNPLRRFEKALRYPTRKLPVLSVYYRILVHYRFRFKGARIFVLFSLHKVPYARPSVPTRLRSSRYCRSNAYNRRMYASASRKG